MSRHVLRREIVLPKPPPDVFAFFADAANLERITPEFLRFQILTKLPIEMKTGTIIDYRIALGGVPMTWRTLIEEYEPNSHFIDVQVRGPYKVWRHTHRFVAEGNATRMIDEVEYEVGFSVFGEVARRLFVSRTVEKIFDYRTTIMQQLFGVARA